MRVLPRRAFGALSALLPPLLLSAARLSQQQQQQQSNPSCEASIDGLPPYEFGPTVLGCFGEGCMAPNIPGTAGYNPAIAPGAINGTNVPYCEAACVIGDGATQEQIDMGPACRAFCETSPAAAGTIENYGWCFYWCLMGKKDVVNTMSCVDAIPYHLATATQGGSIVTYAQIGPAPTDDPSAASSSSPSPLDVPSSPTTSLPSTAMITQVSANSAMTPITSASNTALSPASVTANATAESNVNAVSTSKSGGMHVEMPGNSLTGLGLLFGGLILGVGI